MLSCYLHYSAARPRVSSPRVAAFDNDLLFSVLAIINSLGFSLYLRGPFSVFYFNTIYIITQLVHNFIRFANRCFIQPIDKPLLLLRFHEALFIQPIDTFVL